MMKNATLLLLPLLMLTAGTTSSAAPLRDRPQRVGQTAAVGGVTVRVVKVIEDSRCPANARCIWGGRVVVRADVRGRQWHKQLDLTLEKRTQVAGGALTLVSVAPERYTGRGLKPADYRFTFEFAGGI